MNPVSRALLLVALVFPSLVVAQETKPAAPPRSEPTRSEEPVPKRTNRIHGTATAVDRDGGVHDKEEGSLQVWHKADCLIDVKVHGGQWEAWTTTEAPFLVGQLELGGRSVSLERRPFKSPFPTSVDVRGPWIEDLVLHVVDATTGAELSDLEMLKQPRDGGYARHPGPDRPEQVVAKEPKSPLHLATFGSWFIRAPGHAWKDFDFREAKKPEETLELEAACRLVVDAKGLDPKGPAKLRLEPGNGGVELLTLDPPKEGHVELDSLPPQRVHVRAFLDFNQKPWFWHTVTLGEAVVTLTPEKTTHAEFVVGPPPAGLHEDGTVDRKGIVTVPDGKERKKYEGDGSLEFEFVKVHADEGGRFGRSWSGVFEQTDSGYDMAKKYNVAIVAGAFQLRPPYGTHLHVTHLTLGDKRIDFEREEPLFDTIPDPIDVAVPGAAVEMKTTGATLLHVVAADTKAELSHVEIVSGLEWPQSDNANPGKVSADMILLRDGVSPLSMPTAKSSRHRFRGSNVFWVRAEGRCWARFEQDPEAGGDRYVQLEPACELEVRLEPNVVAPKAVLRVRGAFDASALIEEQRAALDKLDPADLPPGSPSIDELRRKFEEEIAKLKEHPELAPPGDGGKPTLEAAPDAGGTTLLEGLPVGRYTVALELGEWFRKPTVFGATQVDAAHGGRIPVTLAVQPPAPKPEPVPLSGTLFIPPEWGALNATLEVKPESQPNSDYKDWIKIEIRAMKSDAKTPGLYAWSAGSVEPGEYSLALDDFGFSRRIDVGRDGDTTEKIEIAAPAGVVVNLVDAASGEPVKVDQLLWYLGDGSLNAYAEVRSSGAGKSSTFRFKAPTGPLILHVWEQPYDLHSERVSVQVGDNEFTLKLERECGVRIVLQAGVTTIPWDDEAFHVSMNRIDGEGSNNGWGGESNAHRVMVTSPGRYRVVFGRFPGFKPVAAREIAIGRGEMVELKLELEVER